MRKKQRSFSARLSINIMLIVNMFFIITIAVIAFSSHRLIADEATRSASNLLKANISKIEKDLQRVETEVGVMASQASQNLNNEKVLFEMTRSLLNNDPGIVGSAIALRSNYIPGHHFYSPYSYKDALGNIHDSWLGSETYDYFYMDWYQIPSLLGKPCWSEPYYDDGGGKWLMSTYSFPLKDENGEVFAIVTADVSLDEISERISKIKPYESSYTFLLSRNGTHMANVKENFLEGETLISSAIEMDNPKALEIAKSVLKGEEGIVRFNEGKLKSSFAIYGPLVNGWSACTICDYREILAQTTTMNMILILIGLLGMTIIFFLCYFTVRKLTRPLTQFCDSAISIANGNFDTVLPEIESQDEIAQLRNSFQYLQESLNKYIRDLKESTAVQQRMESELNIARQIQQDMLPHVFPHNEQIDLGALLIPAKEVGGDLYDFYIRDGYLYFAIGDVSGKGVPAALVMAITRASFRFVCRLGLPVGQALGKINDFVASNNTTEMFVTMFIGKYNLETGLLEYCNGGHNPIVIIDPDEGPSFLKVKPNIAIGLYDHFFYESASIQLKKNTRLLLYTDGVTEAETSLKDQYGEKRLLEWCRNNVGRHRNSSEAADSLLEDVRRFTGGNEQNDDITILAIKV